MRPLLLSALGFCTACAPPDVRSIDALIRTASPIAWAGTLAWAAASGDGGPCARVEAPDELVLAVGPACPPALGAAPAGEAHVTLVEVSDDALRFSAAFGGLAVDGRTPVLSDLGAATVTPRFGGLLVAWADTDVAAVGEAADVVQGTWVVAVDVGPTPADVSDDRWTLQGARQWVATGSYGSAVIESGLTLVETRPSCRLNPTSGTATIETVQGRASNAGIDLGTVSFHDACDGRATFVSAGSSGASVGEEVDLLAGARDG
ncbi:MAG: hypothetical protein JXB39_16190 [Deltaproteobacteria bacterium]|nr:hypothetical protein [Deltaproteobacteria bacterium]